MKTLKGQNFVHDNNYALFPDGAIQNEIEGTQEGTPVVREVYNDFLMNLYAFLRERGITPNQQEDNANNGYQFINALKRNVNVLNDVEKVLSINGSTWNLNIDFTLIPSKYFVFARAAEDYSSTIQFLRGTDGSQYPFSSTEFKTGDELILILDQSSIRTYNLSSNTNYSQQQSKSFSVFGTPLSYLENNKIWYEKNNEVYNDNPQSVNLASIIYSNFSIDVEIRSCITTQNRIVVLAFNSSTNENLFFYFDLFNLNNVFKLNPSININLINNTDLRALMFFDGSLLYITNAAGNSSEDHRISTFGIDFNNNSLEYNSEFLLDGSYVKTTNSVVHNNGIVVFYNFGLKLYSFGGSIVDSGTFNNFAGSIFKIAEDVYYTDGNNAVKWNI